MSGPVTGRPMQLYWGAGSPPCWRPLLVVHEKEITECHCEMLSFGKNEHKADRITRLNPRAEVARGDIPVEYTTTICIISDLFGRLPTFYHGDRVINESFAICDYLEKIFPKRGTVLLPLDDDGKYAKICQRKYEALNLFKKGNEDLVYWTWSVKPEEMPEATLKKKKEDLAVELTRWEKILEKELPQSYIAGQDFSMADIIFFPTLAFLVRMGVQLNERFPRLRSYYFLCSQRPSVQATWPIHWRNTPDNILLLDV